MVEENEDRKVCLEFADFPGVDMPWLMEKAQAIEAAMDERLGGVFLWHSVVGEPEISGFRVFFEIDPDVSLDRSVPETLISIIREVAGDDLPGGQSLAA